MILLFLHSAALAGEVQLPPVDLQRWCLPADSQGGAWTRDAEGAPLGWTTGGVVMAWQREPLVYRYEDGREDVLIDHATVGSAIGAVSLGRLMVGLELPVMLSVSGQDFDAPPALGDVVVEAKLPLLDAEAPLGLALLGQVWAPTTSGDVTPWATERARYAVGAALHGDLGPVRVAVNAATRGQPAQEFGEKTLDDALDLRLGLVWRALPQLSLSADLASLVSYVDPSLSAGSSPVEALGGATVWLRDGFALSAAAGAGLNDGIGAPQARVVGAVRYVPSRAPKVEPVLVEAPPAPSPPPPPLEVAPPVVVVEAPPPPEPPRTGALELRVTAADGAALREVSWRADEGAAVELPGGVGLTELAVGDHQIEVSAPGYVPARFRMEIEPGGHEVMNLSLRPAAVVVTRERLVISDRIYFDTNRATIKAESYGLLDEIADTLVRQPDILAVRVEGHTDARGSNQDNLRLSELRAAAVRDYLVSHGVSPDRLHPMGYGESRPLVEGTSTDAYDVNRRVEFIIEKWNS